MSVRASTQLRASGQLQTSQVQRKFEELRQSIQIQNSIEAVRQSVKSAGGTRQGNQADFEEEGNHRIHENSVILETIGGNVVTIGASDPEAPLQAAKQRVPTTSANDTTAKVLSKDEHKISLDTLKQRFQTSFDHGLTTEKVDEVLKRDGQNKLTEKEKISIWVKLFHEMTGGFALLLWVSAALCFLAYGLTPDDPSNLYLAIVLLVVIFITTFITFKQNAQSEALMDSFKNFLPQKCMALRNGSFGNIDAINLVVGDIIQIKAGEKIPADIRIIESSEMKVDNSPLTGESEPQLRLTECTHPDNYLETANVAFFGTLCKEGQGKGVVIYTGDRTTLGQIADLSSGESGVKTPLRIELDRFVVLITIIAVVLGVVFFLLALLAMKMPYVQCIAFGIGILVANVPEGLLGCITVSLAITAETLAQKSVLVKNLEAVETLGSTSCICSDKTGTLTQNVMSVYHMWYGGKVLFAKNQKSLENGEKPLYDINDRNFRALQQAAMICSEASFDRTGLQEAAEIDYLTCPVLGDATETGLIRFYQYIDDIADFRKRYEIVRNNDGTLSKMPFNSQVKFSLTIVREETTNSHFTIYVKGAPEKIWTYCKTVVNGANLDPIDTNMQKNFKDVNLRLGKGGERVLGFARLRLPAAQYPVTSQFIVSSVPKFNFNLQNFEFVGLVSLMDPPKTRVPGAINECRSAGIKVIMVTGDQPPTAAAIAKEVNIIPRRMRTNEDIMEEDPSIDWFKASEMCEAIVVHGDRIVESIEKSLRENRADQYFYLRQWVNKSYCVFARTTPAQKLQIVQACQKEGYIVAATGDGVNDSPAIKQADIGISMNISGSDVTKDAADMILLDDDFASIVSGVQEGRKIFDNLKKTVVYLLTSNMTEIIPFAVFIFFQIPLPLSSIYMLIICIGTDIWPAISLAHEEAELDVMTRKPRRKSEHLVSNRLLTIAYLQMGFIASTAGHIGYFVAFNRLGFPVKELFGMAVFQAYIPPVGDFGGHDYAGITNNVYRNTELNVDCNQEKRTDRRMDYDWLSLSHAKYDLRKAFLNCNTKTGVWYPSVEWNYCDTDSTFFKSSVLSQQTACYSTDAIKWAQSVYFVSVVFTQWSNIFACKSRKMSFTTSGYNPSMINGIIFETALTMFLLYVPGIQNIFGGRPLEFWLLGAPAFTTSIVLLGWDETRKFMTRSSRWFLKHTLW